MRGFRIRYRVIDDRKLQRRASYVISTALPTFRDRCYFECTDSATNAETGNNSDGRNLDVAGSCSPTLPTGLAGTQRTNRPVVSNKILGFLETPSNRLASRGRPDRNIGLSRRNPAFMTQRLWI